MVLAKGVPGSRKAARPSAREPVRARPAAAAEHLCPLADDLLHEVVVFQRLTRRPDLAALRLRLIARVRTFPGQSEAETGLHRDGQAHRASG